MKALEDFREELLNKWTVTPKRHLKTLVSFNDLQDITAQLGLLDISQQEFKYFILHHLPFKLPICPECGLPVHSHRRNGIKWPKYCSKKCLQNSDEHKEKLKQINLKKYGVEFTSQAKDVKEKISSAVKATNLKRYGVTSTAKLDWVKTKRKETNLERYGSSSNLSSEIRLSSVKDQSFQALLNKTILNPDANVIPLFTRQEYQGTNLKNLKYKWFCRNCGEIFEADYYESQVPLCPKCNQINISQGHKDIANFLKDLGFKDLSINDKSIISPLELDIYIPSINTAIEFNGDYWHSLKDKFYHVNKTRLCEEKGIHLIHIFEWEWNKKKDLIKTRLGHLNKNQQRIFARKCIIKEIDNETCHRFESMHHLQGPCPANVHLGLFYNDELVAAMTFGKPRFNKEYQWELLRFCSSKPVVGGAGKMLKYFEQNYNPKSIISYANRNWSSKLSNVYEKIGFNLIGESEPGYVYIYNDLVVPRYKAQKNKLRNLLGEENFNPMLSEYDNMTNNGFVRLYDCGNLVFEKKYS